MESFHRLHLLDNTLLNHVLRPECMLIEHIMNHHTVNLLFAEPLYDCLLKRNQNLALVEQFHSGVRAVQRDALLSIQDLAVLEILV